MKVFFCYLCFIIFLGSFPNRNYVAKCSDISSCSQLFNLANTDYTVNQNLDCSNETNPFSFGQLSTYSSMFDGANKTISNLNIANSSFRGLVKIIIKNFNEKKKKIKTKFKNFIFS